MSINGHIIEVLLH